MLSLPSFCRLPLLCVLSSLLVACQSIPQQEPAEGSVDWDVQQDQIASLDEWALEGRLNIRDSKRSDTLNLHWQQLGNNLDINMRGPLGIGAIHIVEDESGILLERSGEPSYSADSGAALSAELLGFEFPAAELYYWVRALPFPDRASTSTFDSRGLPLRLTQRDSLGRSWVLDFDRFALYSGLWLPGRVRINLPPYRLTFLISQWQPGAQKE